MRFPDNLRIRYGYAKALDRRADDQRSNELLQESIDAYYILLQRPDIKNEMFLIVGERCINRMRFRGQFAKAIAIHKQIIDRFPHEPKYRNQLAVTLLTVNRLSAAKIVLQDTLHLWPNDGFAQVHYGFVLKTKDNELNTAVKYLKSGIDSKAPGVIDGRFYFHLGDALIRLGKFEEASKVYEDGVSNQVFLSKYQRSLYNVNRLTGRPWWSKEQTSYTSFFKMLQDNWKLIKNEGMALLNKEGYFKNEAENLRDVGEWKQLELFSRGIKIKENCKKCPFTCKIIETLADAKDCRRGQVKFSVMHPGTHVWPHCGPTNCRLRSHLGLKVPPKTFIRVVNETRSWQEGQVFIFDDSFEHEVWHNGSDVRMVLIVDVWHPELSEMEKRTLPAI